MKIHLTCATVLIISLNGCVTNSGIMQDGQDGFRIIAVGDTGFSSSGSMQMDIYNQATEYCAKKGLVMETTAIDSKQARPYGGYPEASLRFRCVKRNTTTE
jgi:hypothetical protein